jgi:poly(beta-D-mannuronate) lyase
LLPLDEAVKMALLVEFPIDERCMPAFRSPRLRCCWPAVLTMLLAGPGPAPGAERHVRTADEFRTAVSAARPGDVIVLTDGTWRDVDLLFAAEGASEAPITLRAQTPGDVIITGQSRLRIAGRHLVVDGLWFDDVSSGEDVIEFRRSSSDHARDCRLSHCMVTDCNPADLNEDTKWVSLYGSDNRVDHCWIEGKRNAGTTLVVWLSDEPNRHRIDHNYFGPRPRLGENGGETIRVGTSDWSLHDSETVIEQNVFDRCNGEIEIISNKSCANVYRHNLFLRCEGALTLRHGNSCTVEGNVFRGDGQRNTGGVRIVGEDHRVFNNYLEGLRGEGARAAVSFMMGIPDGPLNGYAPVRRPTVVFNTFADCTQPLQLAVDGGDEATVFPQDVVIAGNVLQMRRPFVLDRQAEAESHGSVLEFNLLELKQGQTDTPAGFTLAALHLDRDLDDLLRPTAASPLIDAGGSAYSFATHDFDRQPRGGEPDAGCDEFTREPQRAAALRDSEIGPDWKRWLRTATPVP